MGSSNIGKRIRKFRLAAGMTQAELAKAIGSTPSAVGMYENGRREPTFDTLETIAAHLGVHVNRLVVDDAELLARVSPEAWKRSDGNVNEAVAWQEVFDDFGMPEEDKARLEALHQNPRLGLLFDRARNLDPEDVNFMITYAERILKERDGN